MTQDTTIHRDMSELARTRVWLAGSIAMAVGLHIQPTFQVGSGEIRFSLSDVIGLLLAPFAAWLVLQNRHLLNRRQFGIAISVLAATSLVMTIGLVKAALSPDGVSGWAWVKYVGWYALLYYGVLGVLAGALAPQSAIKWFVRVFVIGHVALIVGYILSQWAGINWPGSSPPRMSGLVDNPNAYGLSLLCALALMFGTSGWEFSRLPKFAFELVCGLLAAGILFSRSLGALGGLFVLAVIAFAEKRDFVRLTCIAFFAMAIYALPWAGNSLARFAGIPVTQSERGIGGKLYDPDKYAFSLSARLASNRRALEMWREAPLLGAGLGAFISSEHGSAARDLQASQIHNTPLWMLAELGIVGLGFFIALFTAASVVFFKNICKHCEHDPPRAEIMLVALMILTAWGTMSLAHEMMYQRVPWFIVGLCAGIAFLNDRHLAN